MQTVKRTDVGVFVINKDGSAIKDENLTKRADDMEKRRENEIFAQVFPPGHPMRENS